MTGRTGTPKEAWAELQAGNARFVDGTPEHPRQDADRRAALADGQLPTAVVFGCSDSRLAAEIIFDTGLGDLFVIRNAGQVVGASSIASIEYAVEVLRTPLVVVLAHDACGAVGAAIASELPDAAPLPPHIAAHVAPIGAAVRAVPHERGAAADQHAVGLAHLKNTVQGLLTDSELVSAAVADGRLAIVGANYRLREGRVEPHLVLGAV